MRKLTKLPSLSNVVAGSQATLNCPLGLTYESIILNYSGVTLAQIKDLRVVINGKTIQEYNTAAELDALNQYYGRGAAANGVIQLYFIRPELDTVLSQRLTAIGTQDIQTFSLEMDIDAAASAPSLTAYAVQSSQQPLGLITKIKHFPVTFAASGTQEIDSIPRSGARIAAIHLQKADVTKIELDANSVKVIEQPKTLGEELQEAAGRTPQTASMTHVDFLTDGDINHALATAGLFDLRLRPTLGTSGQVTVTVEYLDGFAGI